MESLRERCYVSVMHHVPYRLTPKKRYHALPSSLYRSAWMVFDTCTARPVARMLHKNMARTLAHTLNVADLAMPVKDFGG